MTHKTLHLAVATALFATLAVTGCKKKDDAAMTPAPTEPAATTPATPAPAPEPTAPVAAPAASAVSVTSVDVGTAIGADNKITTPAASFAKTDKDIYAAVSTTSTSATAATGKLAAKWTFQDGQVVNEESKDFNFTGTGLTAFKISKPDGWPVGKYKVEISLDGAPVQSKEFEVK